jgi:RNA polymerase sigma-70 factor, ECF subfamily
VNTDETADEAEILSSAMSGRASALAALVERYQGLVFRFLLSKTGDSDLASDLTQETFLKALRGLSSYRGDGAFRVWLLGIARNEFLSDLRRRHRRREERFDGSVTALRLKDPAMLAERQLEVHEASDRVNRLMARLPEKQRTSVWLRLYDGLSFREIGDATGSSEGAARVNYFHGVRKLREWMEDDGIDNTSGH